MPKKRKKGGGVESNDSMIFYKEDERNKYGRVHSEKAGNNHEIRGDEEYVCEVQKLPKDS
jgi:hypothetical protein